jgi:hypothetical protein
MEKIDDSDGLSICSGDFFSVPKFSPTLFFRVTTIKKHPRQRGSYGEDGKFPFERPEEPSSLSASLIWKKLHRRISHSTFTCDAVIHRDAVFADNLAI